MNRENESQLVSVFSTIKYRLCKAHSYQFNIFHSSRKLNYNIIYTKKIRATLKKFIMPEKISFQSNIRLKTYQPKPEKNAAP
jgi:hypothetical protein